ncbi:hypothetical protein [Rugamonas sp.]|uniref:hypothetical protein n=1 Tax=Rugamonas sp. TaxID=1926287 RepID=UPI0025EE038C|nr:hypothetical protein [Rugamonas sp.]
MTLPPRLRARGRLAAAIAALAIALVCAPWLEASMLRHMFVQIPLLLGSGWLLSDTLAMRSRLRRIDEYGITGLTLLLFVSAYWMIPRALELSLTSAAAETGKVASLLLLGLVLPGSLNRGHWIVQLFFLGNFSAMMAIAGIQYQNLPQRLCNAYLLDDQNLTGIALVLASVLLSILWCVRLAPAISFQQIKEESHVLPGTESSLDHLTRP